MKHDMKHYAPKCFWVHYKKLSKEIKALAKNNYKRLKDNPNHPSLQFKEVNKKKKYWSARVGDHYRALAMRKDADYLWFWIGSHETYNNLIKKA